MATILIITANDPNDRLGKLADEGKHIQRLLNSVTGRQYEVVLVPEASTRDIVEELKVAGREVEIIHYAGHAGADLLRLVDGNADAEALAERISLEKTVKLFFLNGCATRPQVRFFHKAGVPFVIATSRPVGDERAYLVAKDFYQYLTLGRSIRGAFDAMRADNKFTKEKVRLVEERGIGFYESGEEEQELPWGLYMKDDADDGNRYRLPIPKQEEQTAKGINHTVFLDKLIYSLDKNDSLALASIKDLAVLIRKGGNPSEAHKLNVLSQHLPSPLAIRLRQIFADPREKGKDYYRELLYDYTFFFETLFHVQLSLFLAQVWDKLKPLSASLPENLASVREFLRQDRLNLSPAAFAAPLLALSEWIRNNLEGSVGALSERQEGYLQSDDFQRAADFFFLHKQYFWQRLRLDETEAIENCLLGQQHLLEAFQRFCGVIQYPMASVGGFNIINMRYVEQTVFNQVAELTGENASYQPALGESPMENKSILCFPGQGKGSLNLFPLIIDRNVFAQETTKVSLYLFMGYFKAERDGHPCYYFSSVDDPKLIWKLDDQEDHLNFLHVGQTASSIHEENHLKGSSGEIKLYLDEFNKQFLTP